MLAVSDVGCGMTTEIQSRIFEPFFTTKDEGKGTGLGLATVYGIVKQTGGNIWVYSELNRGTTFKIFLPRIDAPVEKIELSGLGRESPRGRETILLVEDDVAVRENTEDILRAAGYNILVSRDVEDAKEVSAKHPGPIHLLVTDVVMPRMKGPDLARLLLSSRREMKVLFVSGYTTTSVTDHGVLESGVAFLQKPFARDVILAKVRETLDDDNIHPS
jgi:CheY-like chemotaxis protein